jgi:hypothetical protein
MLNKFLSEGAVKINLEVTLHHILWMSGYKKIKMV